MRITSFQSGSSSRKTYTMSKDKKQLEVHKDIDAIIGNGVIPESPTPVKEGIKDETGTKPLEPVAPKVYDAAAEIKEFGLQPTEMIEYKDPFSGAMRKIMIDRRGTTDEKLALALLDDKTSREQKDSMISMYLFEKGKQGASMLMDLWGYKGQHTKESRAFQSTMRFDFELFLSTFQVFLNDSHDRIWNKLPLEQVEVEYKDEETDEIKHKKIVRVIPGSKVELDEVVVTLGELGKYFKLTSDLLNNRIKAEVQKRERAKGKGIYIGLDNKPYSIHEDGDIVEVVKAEREEAIKQRGELIKMMPELNDDALHLVLELAISNWEQFLEEWNKKYPDKPYNKHE